MSEKLNITPEHQSNPEALREEGAERHEALREKLEQAGEQNHETNVESIRHEALENAASAEKEKQREKQASPAERRNGPIGKKERDASYKATMSEIQTHMSTPSRTFSKVIHNKTVEKVSDVAGSTVARPNAILAGAVFAFILTLVVYLVAKNLGYPLSGFETIGAFAVGWVLGLIYDFLRVMVTGNK